MTQESNDKSQFDNSSSKWNAKKLAKLLGYNYSSEDSVFEDRDNEKNDKTIESSDEIEVQNLVKQKESFELEDEPRKNKTKHTFSNNPFSKFGSVGLIMAMVFGITGLVINAATNGGPKVAPSMYSKKLSSPSPITKTPEAKEDFQEGKLKASLALSDQVREIKTIEKSKEPHIQVSKIKKNLPKTNKKTNKSTSEPHDVQQVTRYIPPHAYDRPRPPVNRIPKITDKNETQTEKPIDPVEKILAINRLGSYGSEEINEQQPEIQTGSNSISSQVIQIPRAKKVLISSSQDNVGEEVLPTEGVYSNQAARYENGLSCEHAGALTCQEQNSILKEEKRILDYGSDGDENGKYLTVGNMTSAKLLTPLFWSQPESENNQTPEKFVAILTKPFIQNKRIIMPKNTEVIFNVNNIQDSGLVQLEATQIVVNNQEYQIPSGAIAIHGNKGKPLVASSWNHKRKKIFERDAQIFALGSLAKIGGVLNQPRSEQFSSNSGSGGNFSFSSVRRGRRNLVGAVLEGGFSPLTQQILKRNQQALEQIRSSNKIWAIKSGTQLQLSVNQTFQID